MVYSIVKKILILGHTGFIGQNILAKLTGKKLNVAGLSTDDINLESEKSVGTLTKYLSSETVLIITVAVNRELGDNLENLGKNIRIISNIAKAIGKKKLLKCVYLSTADVYGRPTNKITERSSIDPKTYYATAKFCCEKILQITTQVNGIPYLILRYNGIWGPGQKNLGYGINAFIKGIINDRMVTIWGSGREYRDSLYVKDLAAVIIQLTLSRHTGVFNIAKGESSTFLKMIKILYKLSPIKFKILKRERTSPKFDQKFDISKLKKALPNLIFTPTEDAVSETFNFLKKQGTRT